jgi:hypothetical protein
MLTGLLQTSKWLLQTSKRLLLTSKRLLLTSKCLLLTSKRLLLTGKCLQLTGRWLLLTGKCLLLTGKVYPEGSVQETIPDQAETIEPSLASPGLTQNSEQSPPDPSPRANRLVRRRGMVMGRG